MKKLSILILSITATLFTCIHTTAQNARINVLTQNAGIVKKGKTVFVEVTINNTDPNTYIGIYKIKAQISVPSNILGIATTGHVLPTGWTITNNSGSTIILSNGKDMIASNDSRTLLIAIQGNAVGGPSTVSGNLSFSNGEEPGTAAGTMTGDNTGDNFSTSTCKVLK